LGVILVVVGLVIASRRAQAMQRGRRLLPLQAQPNAPQLQPTPMSPPPGRASYPPGVEGFPQPPLSPASQVGSPPPPVYAPSAPQPPPSPPPAWRYCPSCGRGSDRIAAFCQNCGKPLPPPP
jgi:hypothetical protein